MTSRLRAVVVTLALACGSTTLVTAQTNRAHLGPRISYNFDVEEVALGAQLGLPLGSHFELYPSFDWYFVDSGSLWAFNADLKYRFAAESVRWLYVGGGLNLLTAGNGESNTEAGLNLLFGVESLKGKVHPFGEGRLTFGDQSIFQLAVGVNFTLGKH